MSQQRFTAIGFRLSVSNHECVLVEYWLKCCKLPVLIMLCAVVCLVVCILPTNELFEENVSYIRVP